MAPICGFFLLEYIQPPVGRTLATRDHLGQSTGQLDVQDEDNHWMLLHPDCCSVYLLHTNSARTTIIRDDAMYCNVWCVKINYQYIYSMMLKLDDKKAMLTDRMTAIYAACRNISVSQETCHYSNFHRQS